MASGVRMRFPSVFGFFLAWRAQPVAEPEQPAHQFLQALGADLERPTAILVISAHWEAATPTLTTAPRLETIHDFSGFDPALSAMRYAPPGAVTVSTTSAGFIGKRWFRTMP
jgi:4,5-DOPA dioxygenase extradiol